MAPSGTAWKAQCLGADTRQAYRLTAQYFGARIGFLPIHFLLIPIPSPHHSWLSRPQPRLQTLCDPATNCPGPCRACNPEADECEVAAHEGTCPTPAGKTGHCTSAGECKVRTTEELVGAAALACHPALHTCPVCAWG